MGIASMQESGYRPVIGDTICFNHRSEIGDVFFSSETCVDIFSLSRPGRLDLYFTENGILCDAHKGGSFSIPDPSQPIFISYHDIVQIMASVLTLPGGSKRTSYQVYFALRENLFSGILCVLPDPRFEDEFRRVLVERSNVAIEVIVVNEFNLLKRLLFYAKLTWLASPFFLIIFLLLKG